MKHLKSSFHDLRELFERSITVKSITEPLTSFDDSCAASQVLAFMDSKNFDIIGVREDGIVKYYAKKSSLSGDGKLGDYREEFRSDRVLSDTEPLLSVFRALKNNDESTIFIHVLGQIGGIVTRGDLQKAPVRMWLFGLISLIEMQLLRIIRAYYEGDSWQQLVTDKRLENAQKLLRNRQMRNVEIDLADCLQFADKRDIILKDNELWRKLWSDSKAKLENFLDDLMRLRDELAHAQDIITGRWPDIVHLAEDAESFLQKCEDFSDAKG